MSEVRAPATVKWRGLVPAACDLCARPIGRIFIDGRATGGTWAAMCPGCHRTRGSGIGPGRGQCFEKQEDGSWLKTS